MSTEDRDDVLFMYQQAVLAVDTWKAWGHVRRYVNEGNDVLTPADFQGAILSYGGVSGVRIATVDTAIDETVGTQGKWKGISTLNNISHTNKGKVSLCGEPNVGKGKTLQWSKVPGENQCEIILNCTPASYKQENISGPLQC